MTSLPRELPDWQRAYGLPPIRARLRSRPEDFQVTEELGFEPDEEGDHELLWIEKIGANTMWVAGELARFAGVPSRDVGFSGLKDRHAQTRQWFSLPAPVRATRDWSAFAAAGVRILRIARHRRKLRRGSHRHNRFRIILRALDSPSGDLEQRLNAIRASGVPNYFGEQRFGRDAGNLALAQRLMSGGRLSRGRRGLALSAARSWLFNEVLQQRVLDGSWNTLSPGDCANLDGSGSVFAVTDVDVTLAERAANLDIHPTGPLWGRGELLTSGGTAALERGIAERFAGFAHGLDAQGIAAARRSLRLVVGDFSWELEPASLELAFTLVRGSFATCVLREVADYRETGVESRCPVRSIP